jgi:hypothetical protein
MLTQANKVNELLCAARNNLVDALWLIDSVEELSFYKSIEEIIKNIEFVDNELLRGAKNGR